MDAVRETGRIALELTNVSKQFDGRPALSGASLQVNRGEVHALLGENGAGKSTLMNIACGLYAPDRGIMAVDGAPVSISKPADAIQYGIGMVHQHFKLVERFSVSENILLSCGESLNTSSVSEVSKTIREKSSSMGLDIDPNAVIGEISIAERQRVEILKMLLTGASILILDEPTAVLTDLESENVLTLLRNMSADGCAVILITHKLREVLQYSDRVTVMRAGETVLEQEQTSGMTRGRLAKAMVGETTEQIKPGARTLGNTRYVIKDLEVSNHTGGIDVDGVSITVKAGEIYGIAGVGGNGQPQLADVLMGLIPIEKGSVTVDGEDVSHLGAKALRDKGLRFIPSDLFKSGLIADFKAYENFGVTKITNGNYGSWFRVNRMRMKSDVREIIKTYQISGCAPTTASRLLSGGNAQKLLLSRELDSALSVVIAHSPTRGLDIQACNTVHRLLAGVADCGAACILISEDLEEILALSNTIGVMSRGKILGNFPAHEITREKIGELMLGHA